MIGLLVTLGMLIGALIWLVLLVATSFSLVTVSAGLLGVVYLTGRS